MKIRNALLLLFIFATSLSAQDNAWQIKLAGGDLLSDVALQNIAGDSLAILQSGQARRIAIEAIVELQRAGKSKFLQGAVIGMLAGGAAGALIAAATYEEPKGAFAVDPAGRGGTIAAGAVVGGIPGFILGGLIGSSAGKVKVYDLSGQTREQKKATLRFIMAK